MLNLEKNKLKIIELPNLPGVLLVDKPATWTSFDVVAYLRSVTKVKTIGHTGTLDPFASGLLIILIGSENTKQQANYLKYDKVYEFTIQLGGISNTLDPTGTIVSGKDNPKINNRSIGLELDNLLGEHEQVPPAFSAKKINGKRAYKLARSGIVPDLKPQLIVIKELKLLNFDPRLRTIAIRAKVSSGTYIRTLSLDIANRLGADGYCLRLRRLAIGKFTIENQLPENFDNI